ncbi:hypothetical protein BBB44_07925 [Bordetella bronchiseptica]|uniref:Uncharacterized protein n=1 Tax=Bordetella genomosp. 6 TaxID=463024 RepID=A0ABX4FAL8_9BORD|nr:hypothetical protein BBB44_07925 [Bordetella bronchiseptica]AZW43474.1 hypothetical protein CWR61_08015 [Bordetella bronchiseptica]OZI75374.1 hypothetical protein CAL23_15705 [Bordetella genomosp. 6]
MQRDPFAHAEAVLPIDDVALAWLGRCVKRCLQAGFCQATAGICMVFPSRRDQHAPRMGMGGS